MYKMQDVVQSYQSKAKKPQTRNKHVKIEDTMEEFENESFPTERPNEEIPVPMKMYSIQNKFHNNFNIEEESKITKNETPVTKKEQREDSFNNIHQKTDEKVGGSATTLFSNNGEELEIVENKAESVYISLKGNEFDTQSPIQKKKEIIKSENKGSNVKEIEQPSTPKRTDFDDLFEEDEKIAPNKETNIKIRSTMKQVDHNTEENITVKTRRKSYSSKMLLTADMINQNEISSPFKFNEGNKPMLDEQTKKLINQVIETQLEFEKVKTAKKEIASFDKMPTQITNSPILPQNFDSPEKKPEPTIESINVELKSEDSQ